jgi:hypothetical protein
VRSRSVVGWCRRRRGVWVPLIATQSAVGTLAPVAHGPCAFNRKVVARGVGDGSGTFPLPGTDKSYCLAHETPTAESRWSSHATLIDPELPSGVAAYRVVYSAGGHVLALHGPAEADEASPASRTNTTDTLGPPLAHALVRSSLGEEASP